MNELIGHVFGNKKVIAVWSKGPFTYVTTECQCSAKTRGEVALGMLVKGVGHYCRKCWRSARWETALNLDGEDQGEVK